MFVILIQTADDLIGPVVLLRLTICTFQVAHCVKVYLTISVGSDEGNGHFTPDLLRHRDRSIFQLLYHPTTNNLNFLTLVDVAAEGTCSD